MVDVNVGFLGVWRDIVGGLSPFRPLFGDSRHGDRNI